MRFITSPTDLPRIAAWLQPNHVVLDAEAPEGEAAVRLAAERLSTALGLSCRLVADALWRRELAGSTALGNGLAIPHARVDGIAQPATLYLRTRTPVDFAAADGHGVTEFLVILVPRDGAPDDHLQLLALNASLFGDPRFRKSLRRAERVPEIDAAFRAGIERVVAAGV